ncbi:MAG TPA: hypothetical protein VGN17_08450 [Bryobacteraceae bacterium]
MILNESLEFDSIADVRVRRAFIGGRPEVKVRLDTGTKLYKWTSHGLVVPVTPWWSFVDSQILSNGSRVAGFREVEERAKRLGRAPRDFARVRSAVTKQWNGMNRLVWIQLRTPAYGFAGKALGQKEDETVENVYLIGGEYQLWIPNLTLQHVHKVAPT